MANFTEGAFQRLVEVYFPSGEMPYEPNARLYVTSYFAGVDSGQVVTQPYTPARVIWNIGGLTEYKWQVDPLAPNAGYTWVEFNNEPIVTISGGNYNGGTAMSVIIGQADPIEAGQTERVSYRGAPGFVNSGYGFSGNTCLVDVYQDTYDVATGVTTSELMRTVNCDFSSFYIIDSLGALYRPAGFTYEIPAYQPDMTTRIPVVEVVFSGRA